VGACRWLGNKETTHMTECGGIQYHQVSLRLVADTDFLFFIFLKFTFLSEGWIEKRPVVDKAGAEFPIN